MKGVERTSFDESRWSTNGGIAGGQLALVTVVRGSLFEVQGEDADTESLNVNIVLFSLALGQVDAESHLQLVGRVSLEELRVRVHLRG